MSVRTILALVCALSSFGIAPAFAQHRAGVNCKAETVQSGSAGLTEAAARSSAIIGWRRKAVERFGEAYSDFDRAAITQLACGQTMLRLFRCEIRARPCA